MEILLAVLCGYLLDLLFGDPHWLPHPVQLMVYQQRRKTAAQRVPQNAQSRIVGRIGAGSLYVFAGLFCAAWDFICRRFDSSGCSVWIGSAFLLPDSGDQKLADREYASVFSAEKGRFATGAALPFLDCGA